MFYFQATTKVTNDVSNQGSDRSGGKHVDVTVNRSNTTTSEVEDKDSCESESDDEEEEVNEFAFML